MRLRLLLIVFGFMLLFSCEEKKPKLGCKDPNCDFLFKSCLCDIVQNSNTHNSSLKKKVINNEKEEEKVISDLDSIAWEKELTLFINSDIKHITAQKFYSHEKVCQGANSLECHDNYTLKEGEKGAIKFIRISRYEEVIDSIEIHTSADNYIYKGDKKLNIYLNYNDGAYELSSYKIQSFQKVITKDKEEFFICGELVN